MRIEPFDFVQEIGDVRTNFGAIGKVHSLPVELQQLESESMVRVVNIELDEGNVVTVPRANVEIIEE